MADDVAGEDSVTWVYATKEYTLKVGARVVVEKESGTEEDGAVLKGVGKRRHLLVLVDDEGEAREVHKAFVRPADIDRLRPLPPDAKAHCDVRHGHAVPLSARAAHSPVRQLQRSGHRAAEVRGAQVRDGWRRRGV